MNAIRMYYGGPRGLKVGETVLPNEQLEALAKVESAKRRGGIDQAAVGVLQRREGYISVTTDRKIARVFASLNPTGGALYQVEIETDGIEHDSRAPSVSFRVKSATVAVVYDAFVDHDSRGMTKLARYVGAHEK